MLFLNYGNVVDPLLRNLRASIPGFAGMKAGDRALDVCCGTGAQALQYGLSGIDATGIDIDEGMLKLAAQSREKMKLASVCFLRADATDLPFPDDTYDFVSISFAVHDKEKTVRDAVVREMKRVVKAGGSLVFIDFHIPIPQNLWGFTGRTIERMAGGEHYSGFKDYQRHGGLPALFKEHSLTIVKSKLHAGGLIDVTQATA